MAEKIVIAELDVDVEALIKSTSELKGQLDALKKSQSELKKAGDTSSATFVQNASDIKVLSQAYNQNIKALSDNTKAVADLAVREDLLNQVLSQEVTTIAEAREQNKLLNKLRNETNATTEEGKKQIQDLNAKLDKNNEFVKENADSYLKQKMNIGNYESALKGLSPQLSAILGHLKNIASVLVIKRNAMMSASTSTNKLSKALKVFKIALISTGIGAIVVGIGALAAAFVSTQKGIDAVNRALAPIKGAFQAIIGVVQNIAVNVFGSLGDRFTKIKNAILNGIDRIRVAWNKITFDTEEANQIQERINKRLKESAEASERIAKRNKAVVDTFKQSAEAIAEGARKQREIVELGIEIEKREIGINRERQKGLTRIKELDRIAKDTSANLEDRLAANKEQNEIAKEQAKQEIEILELKRKRLELQQSLNDSSREDLKELAEIEAQIEQIKQRAIDEELRGIRVVAQARKEAADKAEKARQKAIDNAIKSLENELNLYIAQQGVKAKTLEQQLEQEKKVADREIEILKTKLRNKRITQAEYDTEYLNIKNDVLEKEIELIDENLDRELQLFLDNNQRKIEAGQFFTEQLLEQENERIERVSEMQMNAAKRRLEVGSINEQEYQDEITRVQNEAQAMRDEANLLREAAIKEQKAVDLENQRELDLLNFETELERKQFELEEKRKAEVAAAEKVNADVSLINQRYAKLRQDLEASVAEQKKQVNRQAVGDIAGALGEETAVGKAAALVQAGINVQQGITKALALGGFAGIAKGIAVAATGAKAIGKITGAKFEQGGAFEVKGKRHSAGGTKFYGEDGSAFEAEQGEYIGVLSRNAVSGFEEFNSELSNGISLAKLRQNTAMAQYSTSNNLGVSEVKAIVEQTMQSMPPIYTAVTDINDGQRSYAQVVEGANL